MRDTLYLLIVIAVTVVTVVTVTIILFVPIIEEGYVEIKDKDILTDENGCVIDPNRMEDVCELNYIFKKRYITLWNNIVSNLGFES